MAGPPGIDWAISNNESIAGLVLLNTYYGPMTSLIAPEAIEYYATLGENRQQVIDFVTANDSVWFDGFLLQMSKFFAKNKTKDLFSKLFASLSLDIQPAFFDLTNTLYADIGGNAIKQANLANRIQAPVTIP